MQHTAPHCKNTIQQDLTSFDLSNYNTLQHTATYCSSIWAVSASHTTTHCITLQHTATHCNTLQLSTQVNASHCNRVWRVSTSQIATHCNTLQLTATHCNSTHRTATGSDESQPLKLRAVSRRYGGALRGKISLGHFPQKSPIISGSFAGGTLWGKISHKISPLQGGVES